MATVVLSKELKRDIETRVRHLFTDKINKASGVPNHWADMFYEAFMPGDMLAKLEALPPEYTILRKDIQFRFVTLTFSAPKLFPISPNKEVNGCYTEMYTPNRYIAVNGDRRWNTLISEMDARVTEINRVTSERDDAVHNIRRLIESFRTLGPALKAYPPLWNLLDEHTKNRHKDVVKRGKNEVDLAGLSLDSVTVGLTVQRVKDAKAGS